MGHGAPATQVVGAGQASRESSREPPGGKHQSIRGGLFAAATVTLNGSNRPAKAADTEFLGRWATAVSPLGDLGGLAFWAHRRPRFQPAALMK